MSDRPIIANGDCGDCGGAVEIKLNKNGNAYYYCSMCLHSERWGKSGTKKIMDKIKGVKDDGTESKGHTSEGREGNGKPDDDGGKNFLGF